MKNFQRCVLIVILVMGFSTAGFTDEHYKIGVLANNGPKKALQMWKATADYLTVRLSGKAFDLVPLGFEEVNPAIEARKVDFFLVNSSMFVTAKIKYGATAIATMVNSRQGMPLHSFGGVIISLFGNNTINTLRDLKGKKFMAVEESSLGGWQMAYKALMDAGINPYSDFVKLEFGGKHENVVYAVMNGTVDAGTVRTDTLERMAAAGEIDMADIKIINPQKFDKFPFLCSTVLYPEWPFAKAAHIPDAVARSVVEALKQLKPADAAAKNAMVEGWVDAQDYAPVEALQKTLKIGAFSAAN